MASKEGLESALEFTKFVITLDSGLIAFVTGTSFLAKMSGTPEKVVVSIILALLAVSLIAGIFVYMRAASMFSDGNFDLKDWHLKFPGMINVIAFGLGAIGVGALAVLNVVMADPDPPAPQPAIEIKVR